jgi:ariadne-2
MAGKDGTWIDWKYLLDAAALLARCRYTLQYTYPYVYYMIDGPRKALVRILSSQYHRFDTNSVVYVCLY